MHARVQREVKNLLVQVEVAAGESLSGRNLCKFEL
jgi:hypothetical protein